MSLSLLQSYSSAEEEEDEQQPYVNSSDDENGVVSVTTRRLISNKPLFDPNPPSSSLLPSALDAFSEVSGPPQFLNNAVVEEAVKDGGEPRWRHGRRNRSRDKKDLPSGAVVESKAQLIGIHERVRSDVGGASSGQPSTPVGQDGKRVATVSNPNPEDAAELLRMCLNCGIPKTFSNAKGIICPVCGDRPVDADSEAMKKRGSAVKDKEKLKRMKGQSSHASWKSETEMHLRQQFD